jgi:2-desacetyl-2-hydroxyethyl bacteriochlorophyllide A dehydrogenase
MSYDTISDARRLYFPGKQEVFIESFDPGIPDKNQVRVRTELSLMSTGTENIVFNRLFDAGTHWDNWIKYPFYPGYSSVGVVESVGEAVTAVKVGDRVAYRTGHASHVVVDEKSCYPIPDSVPSEQAVWFALAKITFMGAKAAEYRLGDRVLIVGAGPIGQMSVRWARAAGAQDIVVVDTAEHRMPLAKRGGASVTLTLSVDQVKDQVLEAGNGRLPRVVMDSTGNAKVFSAALGLAENRGRVVIMGDTGQPAQQVLTSDVIMRGLTIIGAHDGHSTPEWGDATITEMFFKLIARGCFPMEGLTSHVFDPENCEEAYLTANRDRAITMGLIFDWK